MIFDPSKSFFELKIIRGIIVATLILVSISIFSILYFSNGLDFFLSYKGFNYALNEVFYFPVRLVLASASLLALLALNHRSNQNADQIKKSNDQLSETKRNNTFTNYFKHKEEFYRYINSSMLGGGFKEEDLKYVSHQTVYSLSFPLNGPKKVLTEIDLTYKKSVINLLLMFSRFLHCLDKENEMLRGTPNEIRYLYSISAFINALEPFGLNGLFQSKCNLVEANRLLFFVVEDANDCIRVMNMHISLVHSLIEFSSNRMVIESCEIYKEYFSTIKRKDNNKFTDAKFKAVLLESYSNEINKNDNIPKSIEMTGKNVGYSLIDINIFTGLLLFYARKKSKEAISEYLEAGLFINTNDQLLDDELEEILKNIKDA